MDRAILEQHLLEAEGHVSQGERHVRDERELIARLERQGHDTTEAIRLLRQFEELQTLHVSDRERLQRELEESRVKENRGS
jgi:hypothetical protein